MKLAKIVTPVKRTTSTLLPLEEQAAENPTGLENLPATQSSSPLPPAEKKKTTKPAHPKGHKVQSLSEIWSTMDAQAYLRLTDTWTLWDVWLQPVAIESETPTSVNVKFLEIVYAPHLKQRLATHRVSVDDFVKIFYIKDRMGLHATGKGDISFEDWYDAYKKEYESKNGEITEPVKMCQFLMQGRDSCDLTGISWNCIPGMANCEIFIRKSCYHSYKGREGTGKIENISVVKCKSVKGAFEYILEGRIFVFSQNWRE